METNKLQIKKLGCEGEVSEEGSKELSARFLLLDVAKALGIQHKKAVEEFLTLLEACPALSSLVEPVKGHLSHGGTWEDTYCIQAGALFAFLGFIGIRQRTRLMLDVFSHPYDAKDDDVDAKNSDAVEVR